MNALNSDSRPALARGVRLWIDPLTGGPVLLFPEGILPLDETTHDILRRCTGEVTLETIVSSLAEEYDADGDTLRGDVCECLDELRKEMLIAVKP
jgi:pyrroloquinoline quinone biosynthesis protein D